MCYFSSNLRPQLSRTEDLCSHVVPSCSVNAVVDRHDPDHLNLLPGAVDEVENLGDLVIGQAFDRPQVGVHQHLID